jgi:GxxExxY protein
MKPLLHPQLTYAVRGVLFDVRQQLDLTLPEKYYQEATAIGLESAGIPCQTEKLFDVIYRGVQVGRYAVDLYSTFSVIPQKKMWRFRTRSGRPAITGSRSHAQGFERRRLS